MLLGAHVPNADPQAAAASRGADCVQVFLSNPQSWVAPQPRADAEDLRASDLPIYVHAPYLVNVASPNNRVRIPSRRILAETCAAAESIGAVGVIVHGGYVTGGTDLEAGRANWRKAVERVERSLPLLIENTAGGERAVARHRDSIARLWEALAPFDVGLCFDTCHAHAAGEDPVAMAQSLQEVIGGIDLLHLNDSKDPPGSGRDRHEALGAGTIPDAALVETVRVAQAPVICETPGGSDAQRGDLEWVRAHLAD